MEENQRAVNQLQHGVSLADSRSRACRLLDNEQRMGHLSLEVGRSHTIGRREIRRRRLRGRRQAINGPPGEFVDRFLGTTGAVVVQDVLEGGRVRRVSR